MSFKAFQRLNRQCICASSEAQMLAGSHDASHLTLGSIKAYSDFKWTSLKSLDEVDEVDKSPW